MNSSPEKKSHNANIFNSHTSLENVCFPRSTQLNHFQCGRAAKNECKNKNASCAFSECTSNLTSDLVKKKSELKFSDIDSNFTSISQVGKTNLNENLIDLSIGFCKNKLNKNQNCINFNEKNCVENSTSSVTTKEQHESDESFLTMANREKHKYNFINPKEEMQSSFQPLRLFNKYGKPLTNRLGRPLVDILGQPLVLLDDNGRIISDFKGNQVFNSMGESSIYSNTNLYIPPAVEEPGIPLLDVDKKHILYLFDNKGHPLTDSLGRPLLKASGKPMFGISSKENINVNDYKCFELKSMYSRAPLENFVRRVQIFNCDHQPLTDESGIPLKNTKIICNKNGMPMCDEIGRPLCFKYGARIITPQIKTNEDNATEEEGNHQKEEIKMKTQSQSSQDSLLDLDIQHKFKTQNDKETYKSLETVGKLGENNREFNVFIHDKTSKNGQTNKNLLINKNDTGKSLKLKSTEKLNNGSSKTDECTTSKDISTSPKTESLIHQNYSCKENLNHEESLKNISLVEKSENIFKSTFCKTFTRQKLAKTNYKHGVTKDNENSKEAIILFDASKKIGQQKSSMSALAFKNLKKGRISHTIIKRRPNKKFYTSNFIEYFKNALNLSNLRKSTGTSNVIFNDYGKPIRDFYGNLLYDKFGIPLTGAQGKPLSEKARYTLRLKLRNIPVLPISNEQKADKEAMINALSCKDSYDQFGDPFYDKHGRPLYDLYGKLNYDIYGRPLTDAFGRPLIDALGQPLMDSQGNVLTCANNTSGNATLSDIFGRRLYDKRGRSLFDSYGRPRFDIFTNAIYDSCGRPASDGNGNTLFDFLNVPIQPHPEKPLYKNARALLPRYVDRILAMPSMHRVLKYSRASLKDVFGGPLFDDLGKPLYNKIGKPLYDKYGRPLYDKDGKPLCDCYGRPLSEEIRQSPNDQTLSVVDSLKLLKLTKESSKWMEIKRSQTHSLKQADSNILNDAVVMKVVQPAKKKSTQYTYALTRVTRFSCGRQALEILEAPLSPSTAADMHNLPVDNKPVIMVAKRRDRIIRKHTCVKHR